MCEIQGKEKEVINFSEDLSFSKYSENIYKATKWLYTRVGYDSCGEVAFIDPPGGPMITLGKKLEDGRLIRDLYIEDGELYMILK